MNEYPGLRVKRSAPSAVLALPWDTSIAAEKPNQRKRLASLACVVDAIVVGGFAFAAPVAYHLLSDTPLPYWGLYLGSALGLAVAYCSVAALNQQYDVRALEKAQSVFSALKLLTILFAILVSVLFLTYATDVYSRVSLFLQFTALCHGVVLGRTAMAMAIRRAIRAGRIEGEHVVLIGCRESLERLAHWKARRHDVAVVRTFEVPDWALGGPKAEGRAKLEALTSEWANSLRSAPVDAIVLLLPWGAAPTIDAMVRRLATIPTVAIHLAADPNLTWFRQPQMAEVGDLLTLRLSRPPLSVVDCALKRLFDVVVGSMALIGLVPLMITIAVGIKVDSAGPVFFRQRRYGLNQQPFYILKFRTMTCMENGDVIAQARLNDPRVTTMGSLLRRLSLDELPQLFNVLRGQMSLVGPRPHAIAHDREFDPKISLYAHRHNVKPGLTGWAQVNGYRGQTDEHWKMEKRVEHDLFYIENWSLLLDSKILLLTAVRLARFKNAY